jgi:hypothetical protein
VTTRYALSCRTRGALEVQARREAKHQAKRARRSRTASHTVVVQASPGESTQEDLDVTQGNVEPAEGNDAKPL